jgi:hypothetical protein
LQRILPRGRRATYDVLGPRIGTSVLRKGALFHAPSVQLARQGSRRRNDGRAELSRDNLDENGASIWMRREPSGAIIDAGRRLGKALIDVERQSASAFSAFLIVAWAGGRPRPRFRSRASRRRTSRTWRIATPLCWHPIPPSDRPKERTLREPAGAASPLHHPGQHHPGTAGDIISEWWAGLSRNSGRLQIGTAGSIIPDWWAASPGTRKGRPPT